MEITFKIIEVNGLNAVVQYKCGEHVLNVGMDFPADATAEQVQAVINAQTPTQHFERLLNPVAADALAALVGLSGAATPGQPVTTPTAQNGVPQTVTRGQGRAALLQAGLLDAVEQYMAAPTTPAIQRIAWNDALTFERQSATIAAMAQLLGLTDAQLDELFVTASQIQL